MYTVQCEYKYWVQFGHFALTFISVATLYDHKVSSGRGGEKKMG